MTTDKPKWWQSWIVYAIVALLVTVGPYVGGYWWLSEYEVYYLSGSSYILGVREFEHDALAIAFWPLESLEAKMRDIPLKAVAPAWEHTYEPGW